MYSHSWPLYGSMRILVHEVPFYNTPLNLFGPETLVDCICVPYTRTTSLQHHAQILMPEILLNLAPRFALLHACA